MALYDYRCRDCDTVFEVSRPMAEAHLPAICPAGHADTVKLLAAFATTSASTSMSGPGAGPAGMGGGPLAMGGGCGGGCACH